MFNPCTCTVELFCFTFWSLNSRQSRPVPKLVNKMHFIEIWCLQYQFACLFLQWRRSCHHFFFWIWLLYGEYMGRLYAELIAGEFYRHQILKQWPIALCGRLQTWYTCVWLHLPSTYPTMTMFWSKCPIRHLPYSVDNVKTPHKLSICCPCRCHCITMSLWVNSSWNMQFICAVYFISFTEVVCWILLSWVCSFVKLYLHSQKPPQGLLCYSGQCANYPAGFFIVAHQALRCLFNIQIFPMLPIVGSCKITESVLDSDDYLHRSLFGLMVSQSCIFSMLWIFLLLLNRCLCVWNLVHCPSSAFLNIIMDPFLFLFSAQEVHFLSFRSCKCRLDQKVCHAPRAQTRSASKQHLSAFAWWCCWGERFHDLAYLPSGSGNKFFPEHWPL